MTTTTVPLFPLRTVLFPGGPLPLRVFEPRYLDMVSRCMKADKPFGVLLLPQGGDTDREVSLPMSSTGTLATIADWYQGNDGLLGLTALGGCRFRLLDSRREADGLNIGEVEMLEPEPRFRLPSTYSLMAGLLKALLEDLGLLYENIDKHYDDASWVSYRYAEVLPLELEEKQRCLEMTDPLERLAFLRPLLRGIREQQTQ